MSNAKVTFQGMTGYLKVSKNNTRLDLVSEQGDPLVTIAREGDGKGLFAVKDYGENEGILSALKEQKLVEETGRTFPTGFTFLVEVRLLA